MTIHYSEMLSSISEMTGLDSQSARTAADATLAVLARTLDEPERRRLLEVLPGQIPGAFPLTDEPRQRTEADFVTEVSRLERRPPEQARLHTQAVLTTLKEQEPELVAELHLSGELHGIFQPPNVGGGVTGPTGGTAPLVQEELDGALSTLPDWTGDRTALRRTISLPPDNTEALRAGLDRLREAFGRKPQVHQVPDGLELTVQTASISAVTALDVELAHRIDQLIAEIGPGIGGPLG
ncbi:DUF2267 domain-containing protein [Sphaerimonospora cavernae]|uniref:Putative pterin-4-alpha-carbinolamine dehydratase n=1 Tax=Sphaerimonospora cavernae TaxID=1740611 RepID=A0ABV6U788_9ACTN